MFTAAVVVGNVLDRLGREPTPAPPELSPAPAFAKTVTLVRTISDSFAPFWSCHAWSIWSPFGVVGAHTMAVQMAGFGCRRRLGRECVVGGKVPVTNDPEVGRRARGWGWGGAHSVVSGMRKAELSIAFFGGGGESPHSASTIVPITGGGGSSGDAPTSTKRGLRPISP